MQGSSRRSCRVLVVDDDPGVRRGLSIRLAAEPDLEVVGAVADVSAAMHRVREARPDLVVMEGRLPDVDGVAATVLLRREAPRLPIVVLSLSDDAAARSRARAAGAAAFVSKHDGDAALLDAIRATVPEPADGRGRPAATVAGAGEHRRPD